MRAQDLADLNSLTAEILLSMPADESPVILAMFCRDWQPIHWKLNCDQPMAAILNNRIDLQFEACEEEHNPDRRAPQGTIATERVSEAGDRVIQISNQSHHFVFPIHHN
jgi:hypothetical protein